MPEIPRRDGITGEARSIVDGIRAADEGILRVYTPEGTRGSWVMPVAQAGLPSRSPQPEGSHAGVVQGRSARRARSTATRLACMGRAFRSAVSATV